MSRNGTSAIYKSMYYLEIVMWSLPPSRSFTEFQHTFLFQKRFVRNTFGTPVQPPQSLAWDRGLRVARNTFLWVLSTHKNFIKDWRSLGSLYRPSERLANDLDCIPHILYYSMKSCINMRLSLHQISSSFTLYIALRPRISLNITHSDSHH